MHVAIIMDGNGRWGEERGLTRTAGHRAGADAVRRTVEAAPSCGIDVLTLYAFSRDNWKRPMAEVSTLMRLFARFLDGEERRCLENDVRLEVIGSRDRLSADLLRRIERVESVTRGGSTLQLRIAIDYSARHLIGEAAAACTEAKCFREALHATMHSDPATPDVDLLIRTGREQRISDFLLFEAAYAELWFTDVLWPDFGGVELQRAVTDFGTRKRRFGGVVNFVGQEVACTTL